MDRGNVLSGAAFSAVLLSAVAFLVALISVGIVAHGYIGRSLTDDLRAEIQQRWDLFTAEYHGEGQAPLIALMDSAGRFSAQGQQAIGLFDARGAVVAGNIATLPAVAGWQQGALAVDQGGPSRQTPTPDYLFRADRLNDLTLVVGQRRDRLLMTNRAMFRTLAVTGLVVVLTMLGAGFFLSRHSLFKLEQLESTLARVSDGDLAARVPVSSGGDDQIDRIAVRMNAHFETLSRLMQTTRASAAAIAHDLKTPLARAYLGLGRALSRLDAGQDPRTEIEDTQAELERMTGIFDAILRLARIESGSDAIRFAAVDLGALVADLADTYQLVAEDAGQSLNFAPPDAGTMIITGDAGMVQQMVANLLQNAVTHGGAGNDIRLHLDRVADQVRLTLTDTGPGIPATARDAVFEPFHRLDTARSNPGSGLGLALVRAVAQRLNARITLSDNAPGLRVVILFAAQA